MPFKSQAQRDWMYANHPEMANRWEAHTPKGKKLPKHVKKKASFIELSSLLEKQADKDGPPNYRPATELAQSCGACQFFKAGLCSKYGQPVDTNYVCDAYQSHDIGSGDDNFHALSKPLGLENNQPIAHIGEGAGLTPDQAFKAGFLMRCIDEKLTDDQILERITFALEKKAGVLGDVLRTGGSLFKGLASLAGTAAIAVPAGVGALGGAALANMGNDEKADPEQLQKEELIAEYNQLSDEAERKAKAKRKLLGLPDEGPVWQTEEGS